MPASSTTAELSCGCQCGKTIKARPSKDGGPKTPKGWRKLVGVFTCPECVRSAYYTRGFRVEIRGLAEGEERDVKEFRAALAAASKASARFGNWYVQRLFAADLAASPTLDKTKDGKDKLPPMPEMYVYPEAVKAFPELSGGCIAGLTQMVRGWYAKRRWEALVALNRSVENYRFGYLPVEVRKQDWSLKSLADGKFCIKCAVAPGKSWLVGAWADSINLTRLRQIAKGDAIPLAMKIVRGSKTLANGERVKSWFFRISAMFPRTPKRNTHKEITLTLGHDPGCLLFGSLEGSDDVFEFPGVSVREIIVNGDKADKKRQQQASMCRQFTSRRGAERWGRHRSKLCEKRNRQIGKQIELAAASLARWCVSHRVTSVDYDTRSMGFVCHFPWHALKQKIHDVLEREGIALHVLESEQITEEAA